MMPILHCNRYENESSRQWFLRIWATYKITTLSFAERVDLWLEMKDVWDEASSPRHQTEMHEVNRGCERETSGSTISSLSFVTDLIMCWDVHCKLGKEGSAGVRHDAMVIIWWCTMDGVLCGSASWRSKNCEGSTSASERSKNTFPSSGRKGGLPKPQARQGTSVWSFSSVRPLPSPCHVKIRSGVRYVGGR
jgi:hypothetical protein